MLRAMTTQRLALASLAAAVALAGCGGDDDETTASSTASTTSSASTEAGDFSGEPHVYFGFIKAVDAPQGEAAALVRAVDPGTPIANAGVKEGDLIVSVDGRPVADAAGASDAFEELSATHDPGDTVKLEVKRGSKTRTFTLQLAPNVLLGAEVKSSSGDLSGVAVVAVSKGGPADEAGVEDGDYITEADGSPVKNLGDLFAILGEHTAGDEIQLTVARADELKEETLDVELDDRTR